jgi:heme A synthase
LGNGRRRASLTAVLGFSMLNGLTLLGLLLQAVWAGQFIGSRNAHVFVSAHQMTAYAVGILALATAVMAISTLRRNPTILIGSIVQFLLVLALIAIGEMLKSSYSATLVGVHVPLAVFVFGLSIYLSAAATRARRKQ